MHSKGGPCSSGQLESSVQGAGLLHMLLGCSLSDYSVYGKDVFACASTSLQAFPPAVKMPEADTSNIWSIQRSPLTLGSCFSDWPGLCCPSGLIINTELLCTDVQVVHCTKVLICRGHPTPLTDIADLCILLKFSSRWQ